MEETKEAEKTGQDIGGEMTIENHQFISLDEILTFTFRCSHEGCGARILVYPDASNKIPTVCPICERSWYVQGTSDEITIEKMLDGLQKSIKFLRNACKDRHKRKADSPDFIGCDISFEVAAS